LIALLNASLTPDAARILARERSWELRPVGQVRSAVSEMPPGQRSLVRAVIVEAEPIDGELIGQLDGLELIACLRSDPVNIDVAAASARGVAVTCAPGRNAEAVADFTLGLCLAAVRNIAVTHQLIVSGELTTAQPARGLHTAAGDAIWRPDDLAAPIPYLAYRGRQLSSLVVGVIGFGAVGQAVARRFAGLVRAVHVTDPAVAAETIKDSGFIPAELGELLSVADVVTIHARSRSTVIGRAELSQMKPGGCLINTARATVLDYDALTESLASGHLAAAALDVFPEEPLPSTSPLRRQPGLTLTPHIAGAAAEVTDRQSELLVDAVRGLYGGTGWDELPIRNRELQSRWEARHAAR
jgi:D-3-phosphoglycerate dehydrogenase